MVTHHYQGACSDTTQAPLPASRSRNEAILSAYLHAQLITKDDTVPADPTPYVCTLVTQFNKNLHLHQIQHRD